MTKYLIAIVGCAMFGCNHSTAVMNLPALYSYAINVDNVSVSCHAAGLSGLCEFRTSGRYSALCVSVTVRDWTDKSIGNKMLCASEFPGMSNVEEKPFEFHPIGDKCDKGCSLTVRGVK